MFAPCVFSLTIDMTIHMPFTAPASVSEVSRTSLTRFASKSWLHRPIFWTLKNISEPYVSYKSSIVFRCGRNHKFSDVYGITNAIFFPVRCSLFSNFHLSQTHYIRVHYFRVVHGSDGPAGRVGSDRVGSGHDFAGFWRVGSGQHFGFFSILLIISCYLNRCESSNTTFGLIDFLRYLI